MEVLHISPNILPFFNNSSNRRRAQNVFKVTALYLFLVRMPFQTKDILNSPQIPRTVLTMSITIDKKTMKFTFGVHDYGHNLSST